MKFAWLDTSAVKAFANELTSELARAKAAAVARGEKSSQWAKRVDKFTARAADFERESRLNIYQRAQLVAQIKECLLGHQWSADDVDAFTKALITYRLKLVEKKPGGADARH